MAEKQECLGCGAYGRHVLDEYRKGSPCPSCGLTAKATDILVQYRATWPDSPVRVRLEAALAELDRAVRQRDALQHRLERILDICNDQPG